MATTIYSIGTYVPDEVRTNAWWPQEIVDGWSERVWDAGRSERAMSEVPTEGAKKVLAAIESHNADPFHGSVERRVMPEGMQAVDMEQRAAEEAIAAAGIDRSEIDLLLGFTLIEDYINAPNPCVLHQRLGLPERCFTMTASAVCNSFQMQLAVADSLIASGRARYALLTQCSAVWRVTVPEQTVSVHMGDGASAVIVGPGPDDRGILAQAHRTDGSEHAALICTVPGKNWWDDGRIITQSLDRSAVRSTVLRFADRGRAVVGECLDRAGLTTDDVGFFACHQATIWFRSVMQEHIGLHRAKSVDIHPWAGSLSAANLPFALKLGAEQGLLKDGDVVAMYQGGTGATYSGTVYRWGR